MTEYKDNKIVLRDTQGNQMSLPLFFKLALRNEEGTHLCNPSSGLYRNGSTEFHGGWDISANSQTDVLARTPAGGSVVYLGGAGGFGPNLIIIKEDSYNRYHYFGHLASAYVHQGDVVQQGDVVGIIGGYGGHEGSWDPTAYPIHLHYEIMDKNIMVDGGWSTDIDHVLDPMDVFDETTLPANWYFGYDPNYPSRNYAAVNYNWDYIPLDNGAIDFGPPGGETPSEPFYTDKLIHDIQPEYQSAYYQSEYMVSDTVGGVIICAGYANSDNYRAISGALDWANWLKGRKALGFYVFTNMNSGSVSYSDMVTHFTGVFQPIADAINANTISADQIQLGFWLDMEDEGHPWGTAEQNFNQYKAFREACTNLSLPNTWGLYGSAFGDLPHFNNSDIAEEPLWVAWWGATESELADLIEQKGWTQAYIHQYTDSLSPISGNTIDGDKMIKAIPTSGGGGGGGGGGSYTEVIKVTVDVIPPKRIYFSPVPGLIETASDLLSEREATITITTDATNAQLYYTIDGSAPYQYNQIIGGVGYALAANALLYENSITIYKDTHIRVVAVPEGINPGDPFGEILAKGSGTFLFKYQPLNQDWEDEQRSYSISDGTTSFFENNLQAFLRLHTTLDEEEILYANAYVHDTQVPESDAEDNASSTGETTPEVESLSDETEEGD